MNSSLNINHPSRKKCFDFIIKDLNQYIRDREIVESRDSIKFIELQISKTPVPEVRKALAKLVELKAQKMMIGKLPMNMR